MAACCCKNDKTDKIAVSCLGRCDLPKHSCLEKDDIGPGHIPGHMGWLYTAKDSPDHQLRCGWRPGHISCPVLRRIEEHLCTIRCGQCFACCGKSPCSLSCSPPPKYKCPPTTCLPPCPSKAICWPPQPCPSRTKCVPCPPRPRCVPPPSCCPKPKCPTRTKCYPALCSRPKCIPSPCPPCPSCLPCYSLCEVSPCTKPMVRIIRHNGSYSITTKPDNITNHPSGPYPLKYVINTDDDSTIREAKFSIEATYNDQHFDYTSSQSSFVLDFSPPDNKCYKPCPRKSSVCFPCQDQDDRVVCPKCGSKASELQKSDK